MTTATVAFKSLLLKKKKNKTQPNLENIFIPYIKKAVPFFDSSFPPLFKTYLFQSPGT